jgi:ATP-binding cassette subfamily F protein uup
LLKIIAGLQQADDGLLQVQRGVRTAFVAQEPLLDEASSVFDAVSQGLAGVIALRKQYEEHAPGTDLDALQTQIEALHGWTWEQRVAETLERLALNGAARIGALSGGNRKRVALAQALVQEPEVLLLDEPTNHLDLTAIAWLESLLREYRGAIVLVTHDRAFLDAVATRIVELDRGKLLSYPGNFATYQTTKAAQLQQEAVIAAKADKLLAQEEVWVRQGVEARRTRSVSRIARLEGLRAQRAARREALGRVQMDVDAGARSGKLVAELHEVSKAFEGRAAVVERFSCTVLRGDKVGLIGPNGAGKTTLLKLMLGELAPDSGRVRRGTNLQIAYFDQMRDALDLDATLADFISPGSEWVEVGGARKHVMSYLSDFLFSPARASAPVRTLSGGERNRLLLARLFARPANVLVLDEPTNDLDIDTLELLEELLQQYPGTVYLVSHDRTFLDNVVTSTIAHEGAGRWREYEGGYEDWKLQSARAAVPASATAKVATPGPRDDRAAASTRTVAQAKKLSYREQRELEQLPARIEQLEVEQKQIGEQLASTSLYKHEPQRVGELQQRYAAIENELISCLERWEELSNR